MSPKYIVAFNRDRDFYQVPIALAKAGKLERLITDFYTPDSLLGSSFLKDFLKRRSTPHIPSSLTASTFRALFLQFVIRLSFISESRRYKLFKRLDRILSVKAGKLAKESNAQLLIYSGYAKEAFEAVKGTGTQRILFVYHPHAQLPEEILEEDFKSSPEIAWSRNLHHLESKLSDNNRLTEEIKMADLVITASSFTRKSVRHILPDYKNITVVPYGTREDYLEIPLIPSNGEKCKFLFVGQGVQRKGLHHLIKAWEESKDLNISLTLVCSVIDPGITDKIKELGIEIKQNLSGDQLKQEFAQADVFIMASLVEGFGLVYLEALAAGCYTIGTENTGLPDLGLTEEVGDILPSVDSATVAQSIQTAHQKWESGKLNKQGIRDFVSQFSWDRFQSAIVEAVDQTAHKR